MRIVVQAHRGFSARYPENTLLAVEKALEVGADRVEVDLALSSDGYAILMHDETLERTTDGTGPIGDYTLEELKTLDAGVWKGAEFAGQTIPTLSEALELAKGKGELNLEIKARGSDVRELIKTAVREVQKHAASDRVVFSSFNLAVLETVRAADPELRLLLLDWDEPEQGRLEVAMENNLYGWAPKAEYATEERLRRAVEAGLFVHIGVALPEPRLLEWIQWGASGFSIDDPEELVDWLEQQGLQRRQQLLNKQAQQTPGPL